MKRTQLPLIVLCACLASTGWAQVITGSGTTNTIPQFTSATSIGDSPIVQSNGNVAIGASTQENVRLNVVAPQSQVSEFQPYAIYGTVDSTTGFSAAVRGDALATSGGSSGVIGVTYGPASGTGGAALNPEGLGFGVEGSSEASVGGGGGGGVFGHTAATSGFSTGVRATVFGTTGGAIALYTETFNPYAEAARLVNRASGNTLVGAVGDNDTPVFRVDGTGQVHANGGFRPFGADFAESMPIAGDRGSYEPGDLLMIDRNGNRRLALADAAYSTLVAGIYSTKPGVLASSYAMDNPSLAAEIPMAIVGVVPCKVSTENGAIEVGDLLVASSTPGHAMKGTDRSKMLGAVIGKALEPLRRGTGVIQVLVTLQ